MGKSSTADVLLVSFVLSFFFFGPPTCLDLLPVDVRGGLGPDEPWPRVTPHLRREGEFY